MIKVVQWATGSMGRTALRRIIDARDLELAGVYVYSDKKNGIDAGQLCKRPDTGVLATNNIEEILALDADLVIHTPRITLPYDKMNADVIRLLASGKNVISTAGFHYPMAHDENYWAPLKAACEKGNATLAGLGVNPGGFIERIVLAATGFSAELDSITVSETVDASEMVSKEFVFGLMGFGADPAVNDITKGPLAGMYTALFSEILHFTGKALNVDLIDITPEHALTLAPHDMEIGAGTIKQGTVAATEWRWTARYTQDVSFTLSILWTSDPKLHGKDTNGHWVVDIEGRPNMTMTFAIDEGDPSKPQSRALTDATVSGALRGIHDVVAAPAGFFAFYPSGPWQGR
ncbi:NAD(P)H-dependent amine dehydrogenase family protein [Brevundimonas pishanensis]|uniref:NAD(P)H-dependent amine dehydrogenase family protein n=1 Tax=Brevundimonas pishanensis TaxID=2896315 RepID=UPI001FA73A92